MSLLQNRHSCHHPVPRPTPPQCKFWSLLRPSPSQLPLNPGTSDVFLNTQQAHMNTENASGQAWKNNEEKKTDEERTQPSVMSVIACVYVGNKKLKVN